jgi:hypothetical protein
MSAPTQPQRQMLVRVSSRVPVRRIWLPYSTLEQPRFETLALEVIEGTVSWCPRSAVKLGRSSAE